MPQYHDASPTWSGFNYQGKVGLFVVLKKLDDYDLGDLENYFINYKLELEWLEDFSIKKGHTYLSVHQVKAYKDKSLSKYLKAIIQLISNSNMNYFPQIKHHLHVTADVSFKRDFIYDYEVNGNSQKFCTLLEIDTLLKSKISSFLQKYNLRNNNQIDIENHFFKLLSIVDCHVKERHHHIQTTLPINRTMKYIDFIDIINSLKIDSNNFSEERLLYEKKEYFSKIVDEYCENRSSEIKDKLQLFTREILNLDNDFIKFAKSISPHLYSIYNNKISITEFQTLLHSDSLKGIFFKIIEQLNKDYNNIEHKYIYKKNQKNFLPTSIIRSQDDCSEICTNILENPSAVEDLYEMDYFITERINCDSIEEEAHNINEISDADLQIPEDKENKITELKKVKMIDIERAKGFLND